MYIVASFFIPTLVYYLPTIVYDIIATTPLTYTKIYKNFKISIYILLIRYIIYLTTCSINNFFILTISIIIAGYIAYINNSYIDIYNKYIKFTDEFITKSSTEFIKYLYIVLKNDTVGIKYLNEITKDELEIKKKDYDVLSILKMTRNEYPSKFVDNFFAKVHSHFYVDGIIGSPYFEGNVSKDFLLLVPKKEVIKAN